MKATPHTHKIEIKRLHSNNSGLYIVKYGDTEVCVWKNPILRQWRLDSAVRRAIWKHDRGSVKAQIKADKLATLNSRYTTVEADVPQWLSDQPESAIRGSAGSDGVNNQKGE